MGVAQFLTKDKGVARKIWDHAHKGTHSNFCLDPPLEHGNSDDVAAWVSKNVIHSPFDLSNGIERVRFLKNRIRQSDDGFRHSISPFTRSDSVEFDC